MATKRTGEKCGRMLNIDKVLEYRNAWLNYKDAKYYLRYSYLNINKNRHTMLVLASISRASREKNIVIDKTKKRTGFMDEFMDLLEEKAVEHTDGVVIENILNPFLPGYFDRRGYTLLNEPYNNPRSPSYYKFNSKITDAG